MKSKRKRLLTEREKMNFVTPRAKKEDWFWQELLRKMVQRDVAHQMEKFIGMSPEASHKEQRRLEKRAYLKWAKELDTYGICRLGLSARSWEPGYELPYGTGLTPRKPLWSYKEQCMADDKDKTFVDLSLCW